MSKSEAVDEVRLNGADLYRADLRCAKIRGASLVGANLRATSAPIMAGRIAVCLEDREECILVTRT